MLSQKRYYAFIVFFNRLKLALEFLSRSWSDLILREPAAVWRFVRIACGYSFRTFGRSGGLRLCVAFTVLQFHSRSTLTRFPANTLSFFCFWSLVKLFRAVVWSILLAYHLFKCWIWYLSTQSNACRSDILIGLTGWGLQAFASRMWAWTLCCLAWSAMVEAQCRLLHSSRNFKACVGYT